MIIRQAKLSEYREIYELVKRAFEPEDNSDGDEHELF